MKKTLLPLVFCFLWLGAKGQNCEPSFDCTTAPILCGADLDGLQATTVLNSPTISIPPNFAFFCQNSVIDNNQWIGFSPCTPSVNLLIQVNGCAMGNGLQAVIFESGDCQDFVAVSNCLTQIPPFTTGVLTADNLVPGNVYYLMIDGFIGDACDYEVSVLSGVDTATPVFGAAMPGHVQGPSVVGCGTPFGNVANYTVLGPSCENTGGSTCPGGVYITPDDFCIFYNWTLPQGAVIIDNSPNFDEVTIDFSNAVSGLITVTSEFDDQCGCHCGYCPTSLGILPFFVQVNQPSVQVLPPLTLCEGDAFFFCGQTYQLGTNGSTFQCTNGCDVQMQEVFVEACPGNCPQHNQPVAPADSCHTAPPFCASYLNGYCSTNGGYTPDLPGNLASTIPCTLENNQWLKFNACSTEVQIELAVSNCLASNGLEFFILQTTDCQIFAAPVACFTIASDGTGTLEATNLSPGETYYLMVDGLAGDVCDWQVLSTFGISEGAVYQAVNTPGQVVTVDPAQEEVCGGATVAFTFEPAICQDLQLVSGCPAEQQFCAPFMDTCVVVVRYDTVWHVTPYGWGAVFVDNDSIGSFANVIYPSSPPPSQAGADSLIFTTSVEFIAVELDTVLCWNSCVAECSTILSATEPCTIRPKEIKVCFPENTNEYFAICPGECITSMGETFCSPGTFTIESIGPCGCINTHVVTIDMIFDSPPYVGQPVYNCSPDGSTFTVSFTVSSSNGFVVTVNGMPVNGIFTSAPIPSGNSFSFLVEQYNICGSSFPIFVAGSHTCQPCTGVTNDLGTIQLCPGDCYSLQGNSYCNPGSYTEQLLNPATNCLDTYIFTLAQIIENQLLVGVQTEICDASSQYYSVGFPIVDGTPPYAVNGNPVTGNFYQSGLIPSGQPYAFTVTDAASCAPQQVNIAGVFDCACINDPGTAQLITLYGCEGEMVSVEFNNDAVAGTGDLHVFILHSGTITSLGNIVGMNTTGTFGFVPGAMSFGQTYHISPAVGPDLGGTVDMTAACFQFGPGQPVVFYRQPAAQILEPDTLTCVVNSLMLNGLAADGSGVFDYHWDGPGSYSASVPNPMVGQPGPYALTVTDNLTGCSTQAAVAVQSDTQPPVFTVNSGEINCLQNTASLVAASQMSGVSYSWTFPTGDVVTGPSISTNIPGDYAVTAIGPNGCTANAATFVDENGTPPSLTATGGSLACNQTTATLSASSNDPTASFAWTLPDGTTATGPTLQATQLGVYQVVAQAQNGCDTEAEAEVVQGIEPVLSALLAVTPPSCFGMANGLVEVVEGLGGSAPYSFSLEGIGAGQSFMDLQAGGYLLQITDANGCTGDSLLQLAEPVALEAEIGEDRFIAMGESVSLTLETNIDPASIHWYGQDGQHWEGLSALNVTPLKSGGYSVVVLDENDCSASDTAFVYVNGQGSVYLPNAFSPNGDNRNDRLTVFAGADVKSVVSMKVYDRWGELVFEDKDFSPNDDDRGWNGEHEGRPLDAAVFIVTAEVEFLDGSRKLVSGDLVLVR